ELLLDRALYRCGDFEELGEGILHEYAHDLRGHLARHAQAVLGLTGTSVPVVPGTGLDIERWPIR
ncbi:MAG TPA: hypothetical protein PKL84_08480, partial [Candidatus Hydrogenedentes bacterium]|nr:hypothetical protein [Candidatus Hydrogenedentota bacterium]